MIEMMKLAMQLGAVVFVCLIVALSMPQSRLRDLVMSVLGWVFAVICAAYTICPFDFCPDFIPVVGWIDDAGAIVAGMIAASSAMAASARLKE